MPTTKDEEIKINVDDEILKEALLIPGPKIHERRKIKEK
jgi:hypothetical protein